VSSPTAQPSLRIDKLLWFLRLSRTREAAQALIASGHLRLDGRRVDRASLPVRAGAVIVLPAPGARLVRVLRIETLPHRRGPPAEARDCYVELASTAEAERLTPIHLSA